MTDAQITLGLVKILTCTFAISLVVVGIHEALFAHESLVVAEVVRLLMHSAEESLLRIGVKFLYLGVLWAPKLHHILVDISSRWEWLIIL